MIVSRFAPAPTGHLHIGHVVNAIYVWGITRACGGRVLLRIEDHDRRRSRPPFETSIRHDLEWLDFRADGPCVRQSDREVLYAAALDDLRVRGLIYACACSRQQIAAASPVGGGQECRYPGTCAGKGIAERPGVGLRVRLGPETEHFVDLRHGRQAQQPSEQCGDVLVRDRDGCWTYQFAVTVDDFLQGVTLVIRGDDLLASTGRQIQLARLLGRVASPRYLHHRLVMKTPTQKLSKADGDTAIADLRARGWMAADVIGEAACLAGLLATPRPVLADDVPALFERNPALAAGVRG